MSCWDRLTGLETGLVLALLVSLPFLVFMIVFYLTVGQVGQNIAQSMHPSQYVDCEHACKCINHISDLISFVPNKSLSYSDADNLLRDELDQEDDGDGVTAEHLTVTDKVWFNITIDGVDIGAIEIGLFGQTVKYTVQNFISFVNSKTPGHGYKGSKFHKVFNKNPGYIQGGDFLRSDGSGSITKDGTQYFKDENFKLRHYSAGWLSMANVGKNDTNGCQFFITTSENHFLDGLHIVFGKVLKGMDVVRRLQNVVVDENYKPKEKLVIADCSHVALTEEQRFSVNKKDPLD